MKTKIILFIALLTTFAMYAVAQSNDDVLVNESRTSKPYHFIHIKGEMKVKIIQDETPGVSVEGTHYQVQNTITWLRNDTLYVYQTNTRRDDGKVLVTIDVDNISLIEVNGKTTVDCRGLINTDFLTLRAYDGARIKVNVRALKVDSKAMGGSFIDLSGTVLSEAESTDQCGSIDSHLLDVMNYKGNVITCCFGC